MIPWRSRQLGLLTLLLGLLFILPGLPHTTPCPVLFGVAPNPIEASQNWDAALLGFEDSIGRPVDIVRYYKRGQDKVFPTATELNRIDQIGVHRIPFYNWKPDGLTWRDVANGAADDYLRELAKELADNLDEPFFLSLSAEMEDEVDVRSGSGQTAADFRDYFRYVTHMLNSNGVTNVVTVMNYTGSYKWASQPWFLELYPGDDVVDWIAQDPYAYDLLRVPDLTALLNQQGPDWPGFYTWAATTFPDKPQMLGEWGVHDPPDSPRLNADFLDSVAKQLPAFPRLRALVYWNHGAITADGRRISVGTTAVDSSKQSLLAFRRLAHSDILTAPWSCPTGVIKRGPAT